jgi:hypothetical protein
VELPLNLGYKRIPLILGLLIDFRNRLAGGIGIGARDENLDGIALPIKPIRVLVDGVVLFDEVGEDFLRPEVEFLFVLILARGPPLR